MKANGANSVQVTDAAAEYAAYESVPRPGRRKRLQSGLST
jgi:hypothetical protein